MILRITLTIVFVISLLVSCISTINADNGSTVNNTPTNDVKVQKDVEQNKENTDNITSTTSDSRNTNTTVETSTSVDFSKNKK